MMLCTREQLRGGRNSTNRVCQVRQQEVFRIKRIEFFRSIVFVCCEGETEIARSCTQWHYADRRSHQHCSLNNRHCKCFYFAFNTGDVGEHVARCLHNTVVLRLKAACFRQAGVTDHWLLQRYGKICWRQQSRYNAGSVINGGLEARQ